MDRVVPVAVKAMPLEAYRRQLRIGDGDATRVLAAVEFRPNAESGPTVRRANEAHDRGEVDEWRAARNSSRCARTTDARSCSTCSYPAESDRP